MFFSVFNILKNKARNNGIKEEVRTVISSRRVKLGLTVKVIFAQILEKDMVRVCLVISATLVTYWVNMAQ